jgi:hypothetical protein
MQSVGARTPVYEYTGLQVLYVRYHTQRQCFPASLTLDESND